MKIDFKEIARNGLANADEILYKLFPAGRVNGHEFEIGSLSGEPGSSLKFNLRTGKWADFASGSDISGGDIIDLVKAARGCTMVEAAEWVSGQKLTGERAPNRLAPPKEREPSFAAVYPVLNPPDPGALHHYKFGKPNHVYIYRDAEGKVLNYVCRFDFPGQKPPKEFFPHSYGKYRGRTGWHWRSIPLDTPLYNLPALNVTGTAVMVVEGEKAADAAQLLFPGNPVVTWQGGAKRVRKADWKPLHGRSLILWPDNDEAGRKAMHDIAGLLQNKAGRIRILDVQGKPEKWDAADLLAENPDPKEAAALIAGWMQEYISPAVAARAKAPRVAADSHHPHLSPHVEFDQSDPFEYGASLEAPISGPPLETYTGDITPKEAEAAQKPITMVMRALGYNREVYYYYSFNRQQIYEIPAASHNGNNLLNFANLDWWDEFYKGRGGVRWQQAASDMMEECAKVGVFDTDRVRGRGAWWDDKRVVIHLGDKLLVDDNIIHLENWNSEFIYERKVRIPHKYTDSLPIHEAQALFDVCKALKWENRLHAYLLAGWCVVAPISGALKWRPHIWLTGGAGSGKTWVMENIISKALGNFALNVKFETTEAGLRQLLELDALPIIFDEIKGESPAEQQRIQSILGLMRQASSETSAKIIKGSASGRARLYSIRSCFALASIGSGLREHADETRVTVLSLRKNETDNEIEKENNQRHFTMMEEKAALLDEVFAQRLFARTARMVPLIRKNCDIFANAAAKHLNSQRMGDQIGTLLGGAYSLFKNKVAEVKEAEDWIFMNDVKAVATDSDPDDIRCMSWLLQKLVRMPRERGYQEFSIGELVHKVANCGPYGEDEIRDIVEFLSRRGIKVEGGSILLSISHYGLEEIYRETPWRSNWYKVLRQNSMTDDFEDKEVRFADGKKTRVVRIFRQRMLGLDEVLRPPEEDNEIPF